MENLLDACPFKVRGLSYRVGGVFENVTPGLFKSPTSTPHMIQTKVLFVTFSFCLIKRLIIILLHKIPATFQLYFQKHVTLKIDFLCAHLLVAVRI